MSSAESVSSGAPKRRKIRNLEAVRMGDFVESLEDCQLRDTMSQISSHLSGDLATALRVLHLLKSGSLKPKQDTGAEKPFHDSCNKFSLLSKERCLVLLCHITGDDSWRSHCELFAKGACTRLLCFALGTEEKSSLPTKYMSALKEICMTRYQERGNRLDLGEKPKPKKTNDKGTEEYDFKVSGVYKLVASEVDKGKFDRIHYIFKDIIVKVPGGAVDNTHQILDNHHEMTAMLKGSGIMHCMVHEIFKFEGQGENLVKPMFESSMYEAGLVTPRSKSSRTMPSPTFSEASAAPPEGQGFVPEQAPPPPE
jgi:hypothetical protein